MAAEQKRKRKKYRRRKNCDILVGFPDIEQKNNKTKKQRRKQICDNLAGFPDEEPQLLLLLHQRLVRRRLPRCHWRKIIDYFT